MPLKNGFDTIFEIRNNNKYKHSKVIAHTASLIAMTNEELIASGFDEILLKPFIPKVLLAKLDKMMN